MIKFKKVILKIGEKLILLNSYINKHCKNRKRYVKYAKWCVYLLMSILFVIFLLAYNTSVNISPSLKTGLYFHYPMITKPKRNQYVILDVDKFEYSYKTKTNPIFKNTKVLKQVKGVPNDKIEYKNSKLYINGGDMGYVFDIEDYPCKYKDGDSFTLKDDQYYVLGTSTLSFDSRYIGELSSKEFLRKAIFLQELKSSTFSEREKKIRMLTEKAYKMNNGSLKIKDKDN